MLACTFSVSPQVWSDIIGELETAAAESVSKGWLLQVDADIMIEEETQRAVSLGLTN